jgi:hypothetical protein
MWLAPRWRVAADCSAYPTGQAPRRGGTAQRCCIREFAACVGLRQPSGCGRFYRRGFGSTRAIGTSYMAQMCASNHPRSQPAWATVPGGYGFGVRSMSRNLPENGGGAAHQPRHPGGDGGVGQWAAGSPAGKTGCELGVRQRRRTILAIVFVFASRPQFSPPRVPTTVALAVAFTGVSPFRVDDSTNDTPGVTVPT